MTHLILMTTKGGTIEQKLIWIIGEDNWIFNFLVITKFNSKLKLSQKNKITKTLLNKHMLLTYLIVKQLKKSSSKKGFFFSIFGFFFSNNLQIYDKLKILCFAQWIIGSKYQPGVN
jgi:hypothetical protein